MCPPQYICDLLTWLNKSRCQESKGFPSDPYWCLPSLITSVFKFCIPGKHTVASTMLSEVLCQMQTWMSMSPYIIHLKEYWFVCLFFFLKKGVWRFWSYEGNVQGWRQANVKNRRILSPVRQTERAVFQSLPLLRLADLSWRLKTAPYPQICTLLLKGVTVPEITRKQNFKYQLQGHDTRQHISLIREIQPRRRGFLAKTKLS